MALSQTQRSALFDFLAPQVGEETAEAFMAEFPAKEGEYRPRNYDERFRGLVSVRTALASSLNVPAVRTLDLIGEEAAVEQLRRLGFAGLTESGEFYGPSMALGSADVSLWELVQAYRSLARAGRSRRPAGWTRSSRRPRRWGDPRPRGPRR